MRNDNPLHVCKLSSEGVWIIHKLFIGEDSRAYASKSARIIGWKLIGSRGQA